MKLKRSEGAGGKADSQGKLSHRRTLFIYEVENSIFYNSRELNVPLNPFGFLYPSVDSRCKERTNEHTIEFGIAAETFQGP